MLWRMMKRIRAGRVAGLFLLGALLALRVADPGPVQQLRLAAFDLYHQLHPRKAAQVPVTILDIDDPSLEAYGQWPWPRSRVAEMVMLAFEAGAVALAFDIVFAEPDRLSPPPLRVTIPISQRTCAPDWRVCRILTLNLRKRSKAPA